jgi:hypothetical protein
LNKGDLHEFMGKLLDNPVFMLESQFHALVKSFSSHDGSDSDECDDDAADWVASTTGDCCSIVPLRIVK